MLSVFIMLSLIMLNVIVLRA